VTKKSEGIKRLVLASSFSMVLGWMIFVAVDSNGFNRINSKGWLLIIIGIFVSFFIPIIISKVTYWIKDGFYQDKNSD